MTEYLPVTKITSLTEDLHSEGYRKFGKKKFVTFTGELVIRQRWIKKEHANWRQRERKKRLEWHKISFPHDNCDWHHVNKKDVTACPRNIHRKIHHEIPNNIEGITG